MDHHIAILYLTLNLCFLCLGQSIGRKDNCTPLNDKDFAQLKQRLMTDLRPVISQLARSCSSADTPSSLMETIQEELTDTKRLAKEMNNEIGEMSARIQQLERLQSADQEKERTDCRTLYDSGQTTDGVYTISPDGDASFDVYCSEGWTALQHRYNGSVNFTKSWTDYVDGFGQLTGDFWLGLEKMHLLTKDQPQVVAFLLQMHNGTKINLRYDSFMVEDVRTEYRLNVSDEITGLYNKTTFLYNSGHRFTTFDRDNAEGCGRRRYGGWWYDDCTYININGLYNVTNGERGMTIHVNGKTFHGLRRSIMRIQRKYT